MTNQVKFLIACNARSGSTWLESMLGELPDATVDFELVWRPANPDLRIIQPIEDASFNCADFLAGLSGESAIVGSKLVMERSVHTEEEYSQLRSTIGPDIRIVHLVRDYADVFYSLQRGMYKLARENAGRGDTQVHQDMRERETQTAEYMARMNDLEFESRWRRKRRLTALPRIAWIRSRRAWASLRAALAGQTHRDFWDDRREVSTEQCAAVLDQLLDRDRWIGTLHTDHTHFMTIDYAEIETRFHEVSRFLGSSASADQLRAIVERPPTRKLPSIPMEDFFKNAAEIVELCKVYESRKAEVLSQPQ